MNRAFLFGDGFFESIRVQANGHIPLLEQHYKRARFAAQVLKFEWPSHLDKPAFQAIIHGALSPEEMRPQRVRITFYRDAEGLYRPAANTMAWQTSVRPLDENPLSSINRVGVYDAIRLQDSLISSLKTCSALPYVMAAMYAEKQGFDDVLLLHESGHVAELTASNLFFYNGHEFVTPSLSSGCVAGVFRDYWLEQLSRAGYAVQERAVQLAELAHFEAAWACNAVQGLRPVRQIADNSFLTTGPIQQQLSALLPF